MSTPANATTAYDGGLYSQPSSPYSPRTPLGASAYARSGYYNASMFFLFHLFYLIRLPYDDSLVILNLTLCSYLSL